ncbi:MAG: CPBP family intramembrane metalloprotease, partial [Planctomycetes bacterium]|nr:CPBP family intramembrane metalloprotease [Planctomycetota bacterium]
GASRPDSSADAFAARARDVIRSGEVAAVVRIPHGFSGELAEFRTVRTAGDRLGEPPVPRKALSSPEIVFDAANEKSRITNGRLQRILTNWRREIVRIHLADQGMPAGITEPFVVQDVDISEEMSRRAALWSKILPFVLFVWALTGAFYPAVDLCAGEKERGTLETLLTSPAGRGEIVLGKLLTIMGFSAATSLLNLVSLAVTSGAIIMLQPAQIPIGPPPVLSLGWLLVALVPISALFSALALAIAAFARSTKEGQYYLMPLLLISLPLMILPMLPSVELDLGTSLVPITGMMLLLQALFEGQFVEAITFLPPVAAVTAACCFVAIRWAVNQFNNESVLFRESERWDPRLWIRHVFRSRGMTPTMAQAVACGVLLLTIRFFAVFAAPDVRTWHEFARMQFLTLVVLVALPALLLTMALTRSPRATLLLTPPRGSAVLMAALLAVALHPVAMLVSQGVQWLYPIHDEVRRQMGDVHKVIAGAPNIWYILGLLALVPAVCEELAFRGFILSGLRHTGSKWTAILLSSAFFGLTHGILQQSISAALVGAVIGYVAVHAGSLLPCITFHLVYNSLTLLIGFQVAGNTGTHAWLAWLFEIRGDDITYRWPAVLAGVLAASALLAWFRRLPYEPTPEERLRWALRRQSAGAAAS